MSRIKILLSHRALWPLFTAPFVGLWIIANSGQWWVLAFSLLGIPAQMLNEYSLHRYIFHLPPPKTQARFNLLYEAHYGHHDFPTNLPLFFVPIWVSLPMLFISLISVWIITSLILSAYAVPLTASIVLIGGVITFLSYEWFHMTAHLTVPKHWIEQHVTKLHNQHHFRDFSKWFHVSPGGQIIDKAMGTAIDREALKNQQRSEFIRTLGMRPDDQRLINARNHFAGKYGLNAEEIERAAKI